jgi:hypothetical protein
MHSGPCNDNAVYDQARRDPRTRCRLMEPWKRHHCVVEKGRRPRVIQPVLVASLCSLPCLQGRDTHGARNTRRFCRQGFAHVREGMKKKRPSRSMNKQHPSCEERRTMEETTRTMERRSAQEQICSLDEIGHQRGETRAARGTHSGSGRMAPDPGRGHGGRPEKPLRGTRVGSRSRGPTADARDTLLEAEALCHSLHRGGGAVGEPPDHGARSGVGSAHGSRKPVRNRAESCRGTHGSPSSACGHGWDGAHRTRDTGGWRGHAPEAGRACLCGSHGEGCASRPTHGEAERGACTHTGGDGGPVHRTDGDGRCGAPFSRMWETGHACRRRRHADDHRPDTGDACGSRTLC